MDKNILQSLIKSCKSTREISNECKVSQSNVRYWLKKYDLKTNPKKCYKCNCGETNPDNFYGNKKSICSKCHNQYTIKKGQEKRNTAIDYLGGKCVICGFSKWKCSLHIHHLDKKKKDPNFKSMRGWSWTKIKKEIKGCVILCGICHPAVHQGFIEL